MDWVILKIPVKKCNVGMLLMCLFDGKLCSCTWTEVHPTWDCLPQAPKTKSTKMPSSILVFFISYYQKWGQIYTVCRPTVCLACIAWLNPIRFSPVQKIRSIYGFTINHDVFLGQEKSSVAVNGKFCWELSKIKIINWNQ